MLRQLLVGFVCAVILAGCSSTDPVAPVTPGELVKVDLLGMYDVGRIQAVIDQGLPLFFTNGTMSPDAFRSQLATPKHGVKLYKIAYQSVIPEKNSAPVTAYGLVVIPDSILPGAPIVSYQHGTIFDRSWVPSNPDGSIETQFMISQFASQGYIVIAPDYFGTTPGSTAPNSYFVAQSTAQACIDMYRASMAMLQQQGITPGKLFINGWSQGGYSTLLFLRALELANIPVAAAATASGPADPLLFVSSVLNNTSPFFAGFSVAALTNLMLSMDAYQGLNGYVEEAVVPKYLDKVRKLHRFEMTFNDFEKDVPLVIDSLYTDLFYADSRTATKPFWKILDAGAAYRWRMKTPLRAFYSYRDEAIPWQVARIAADYQNTIGNATAEAIDAGATADHRAVYIYSLINIKPWFDSLR